MARRTAHDRGRVAGTLELRPGRRGHARGSRVVVPQPSPRRRDILRVDSEPWLAVDPKRYTGDPAYGGGTLLTSRAPMPLEAGGLRTAVHRMPDVFAEAAELDRGRVLRWAQFHAVQAAFRGRRHGFRIARAGSRQVSFTAFFDRFAELLADRTRTVTP